MVKWLQNLVCITETSLNVLLKLMLVEIQGTGEEIT